MKGRIYRQQQHPPLHVLLLKTGLRISELCGLTVSDLDFENKLINVDHQLLRNKEVGYYIETPKTKSGVRQVPMSEETYQTLQKVVAERKNVQPIVIDGYKDFVFLNQKGYPMTGAYYTSTFGNLVKKYNKSHEGLGPVEGGHSLHHRSWVILISTSR
ncbi:site-specific integrase [[Clostridium] innocuum]|nr:site-specific integrase [[Clostridium] innocuum]